MGDVLNSRAMVLVAGVLGAESLKHLLASLSICLHLSVILSIYLSVCLSACLSVCLIYILYAMWWIMSNLNCLTRKYSEPLEAGASHASSDWCAASARVWSPSTNTHSPQSRGPTGVLFDSKDIVFWKGGKHGCYAWFRYESTLTEIGGVPHLWWRVQGAKIRCSLSYLQ
jgi:hypothetical protein